MEPSEEMGHQRPHGTPMTTGKVRRSRRLTKIIMDRINRIYRIQSARDRCVAAEIGLTGSILLETMRADSFGNG
jgi:hypothetical protein